MHAVAIGDWAHEFCELIYSLRATSGPAPLYPRKRTFVGWGPSEMKRLFRQIPFCASPGKPHSETPLSQYGAQPVLQKL
jgi:hypothetical protein